MAFQEVLRNHATHTRPGHSGELHWNAKLTRWDIRAIIQRCEQGEAYADIGRDYGISRKHVLKIHRKESRKDG